MRFQLPVDMNEEFMELENFRNLILDNFIDNDWRKILNLNVNCPKESARKLMWAWPSENDLIFFKEILDEKKINRIVSIGCGCGLFEWLLGKCAKINVRGIEVNETWWKSRHSGPKFIPLNFQNIPPNENTLNEKEALIFCYFNDEIAFQQYLSVYRGNLLFIIGPTKGTYIYTTPDPIEPKFNNDQTWQNIGIKYFKNGIDVVTVFEKRNSDFEFQNAQPSTSILS